MTEPEADSPPPRAPSIGATGGLPGANAAPQTRTTPAGDLAGTVATGAATEPPDQDEEDPLDDAEAVRVARIGGYLEEDRPHP
jgi:hypothetical protein